LSLGAVHDHIGVNSAGRIRMGWRNSVLPFA
jgi:hypothetical protein